jgi:hypothetical protein
MAQLLTFVEHKYEIEDISLDQLETVEDVLKAVVKSEGQKKLEARPVSQKRWPDEASRPQVLKPAGKTLHEAFLRSCDRMDSFAACSDQTMGGRDLSPFKNDRFDHESENSSRWKASTSVSCCRLPLWPMHL